jgi:transcriptional regulator with XRE-family HTH domain
MGIAENLKKIRVSKGYTRVKLENMSGVRYLYQKETGLRGISEKDLNKLSTALGCLKSDLVGDSEFYKSLNPKTKLINLYDLKQFNVNSLTNKNDIVDVFCFDETFIVEHTGSENIILLRYNSNFMQPSLQYGDDLFIDLRCNKFLNNGIYLVKENGSELVSIKRAFKKEMHKSAITLSYDNTSSGLQITEINEEDFFDIVIGKVVSFIRNIREI